MENDLIYRGSVKIKVSDTWWSEIDSIPAVDAVEVVRCRECRYFCKGENDSESWEWCDCWKKDCWEDCYCACGQRREEEHNAVD